ncbi:hypothetical protein [Nonomuraea typhae]|uniref:hypothetical protein n=1 Tax=Nonomuraea typhae TaxID=2603600 RepID=UPI0012F855F1|nr:hypothetical protein [Nonomuraea typhae]
MDIDRSRLRATAEAYDVERRDLADAVRRAADELTAIGDFWGTSKPGTTFFKGEGRGYEAATDQIAKGLTQLDKGHASIAHRLRLMGDVVQVADWDTIAEILARLPEPDEDPHVWGESP